MGSRAFTCDSGCDRYVRLHHPRLNLGECEQAVNVRYGSIAACRLWGESGR